MIILTESWVVLIHIKSFTYKQCIVPSMEGSKWTDITAMYMGGINPVLHFDQHWYIGISLGLILEVFNYFLMTILSLKLKNI